MEKGGWLLLGAYRKVAGNSRMVTLPMTSCNPMMSQWRRHTLQMLQTELDDNGLLYSMSIRSTRIVNYPGVVTTMVTFINIYEAKYLEN